MPTLLRPTHSVDPTLSPDDDLTRRGFLAGGIAASALALAGCGSDESASAGAGAGAGAGADKTHEVTDYSGKVTIPARPERIVADSVSVYAHLVTLGIEPVGVALNAAIDTGYFAPEDAEVVDVVADDGWTIDLEEALPLRPDLIVAVGADWNDAYLTQYRKALATYAFESGAGTATDIKEKFLKLGSALGREQEALDAISEYDDAVADAKQKLAPVAAETGPVGVVRFDSGEFIGVRPHEDIPHAVLTSIGLTEPEWPDVGDSGYVELSMETLGVLNRAKTLFVTTDDDVVMAKMDVFKSPIWKGLGPVAAGRAHFVGAWNGDDLAQLTRMIDDVVEAVTT